MFKLDLNIISKTTELHAVNVGSVDVTATLKKIPKNCVVDAPRLRKRVETFYFKHFDAI